MHHQDDDDDFKYPDDGEIFAGSPLVLGENRDAYRRLFRQTWPGICPQDGFEIDNLRQMVNYLCMQGG